jgi:hypothetical protein
MTDSMTREELNAYARDHGVDNPESYGTKAELQAAIDSAPAASRPTGAQEAAADQEAATPYGATGAGKDATLVVYMAGYPYPPPSGRPDGLWTQEEFDAVTEAQPELNLFTVDGTKVDRGQAE